MWWPHRYNYVPRSSPAARLTLFIRCIDSCVKASETAKYPPVTTAEHYLGKLMKAGHSQLDATAEDAVTLAQPREAQPTH